MVKEECFEKCKYTLKDLETFRTQEGFLDLSLTDLVLTDRSKEPMGNQNRIKNWVRFGDDLVLIKGEIQLDTEANYGIYSELIVEEIGKSLGVSMAHYDLVQLLDQQGKLTHGVLSVAMIDPPLEHLHSLRSMIGDEDQGNFADATDYDYTIQKLKLYFTQQGISKEEVERLLVEYKKRLAFSLLMLETDKHVENFSFIESSHHWELSPNYDSEAALLLDNDITTVRLLLGDYQNLKLSTSIAQPRIGKWVSSSEGGFESLWKDTLEALIEDDEVYDYCNSVLRQKIDMDEIFQKVERRIHAPLCEEVRLLSKYAYLYRYQAFMDILDGVY